MPTLHIGKEKFTIALTTWTKHILQKTIAAEEAQEFKFHSVHPVCGNTTISMQQMDGNSTITITEAVGCSDGILGIFEPNDEAGLLYETRDDGLYIAISCGENLLLIPTLSNGFRELIQKHNPSATAIIMRGIDGFKCALKNKYAEFKMESEIA